MIICRKLLIVAILARTQNIEVEIFFATWCAAPPKERPIFVWNKSNVQLTLTSERKWVSPVSRMSCTSLHVKYLRQLLIINILLDVFIAMQTFPILCIVFCCTFGNHIFCPTSYPSRGRRGRYRMVIEFTTTCKISPYHH